jgi:hypothetical protein
MPVSDDAGLMLRSGSAISIGGNRENFFLRFRISCSRASCVCCITRRGGSYAGTWHNHAYGEWIDWRRIHVLVP